MSEVPGLLNEILAELKEIKLIFRGYIAKQEALQPDLEYTTVKETIHKLPKSTKKLDAGAAGKVYNFMGKGGPYTCKKCGGLISWDLRPERIPPLHVDKDGHMIGNGDCPEFGG